MLDAAIERVLRHPVTLTAAGRTDAGVHAWGQVVTFDVSEEPEGSNLARPVAAPQRERACGPAIVVRSVALAPADFDARFSADLAPVPTTPCSTGPGAGPLSVRNDLAGGAPARPPGAAVGLRPAHR